MTDLNNKRTDAVDHAARMINRISTAGNRTAIYEQLYDAGFAAGAAGGECYWSPEDDNSLTFQTSCDNNFEFNDDGPIENGCKFCMYCGCRLVVQTTAEQDDYRPEQPEVTEKRGNELLSKIFSGPPEVTVAGEICTCGHDLQEHYEGDCMYSTGLAIGDVCSCFAPPHSPTRAWWSGQDGSGKTGCLGQRRLRKRCQLSPPKLWPR